MRTMSAFHLTKYSGLKFRVFYEIFRFIPGHQVPEVSRENTKSNGRLFDLCLLALGLLDDAEVELNDVLGDGDNITFIVKI